MALSAIAAQFIIGIHRAYFGLLKPLREYLLNKLPAWAGDPLFDCPNCMASLYSIPVYFPFMLSCYGVQLWVFCAWLIFIPVVSCLANYIDNKL